MKIEEYFENLIEEYFDGKEGEVCVSCKTGMGMEDMEELDECEDYDDYSENELEKIYQEKFDSFFENEGYELTESNCAACGPGWAYTKEDEDSEYDRDYIFSGNHIQILKEENAVECPACRADVTKLCNGYHTCKCGEIF